jgi:hypothetical protein
MTTKKEVIQLDTKIFGAHLLEEYEHITNQIKNLEAEKEVLKAMIHKKLEPVFDPVNTSQCLNYTFTARQMWECDQVATFEAFKKEANRKVLFPKAIEFKPGKDKDLAKEFKLLTMTFSNPVIAVK